MYEQFFGFQERPFELTPDPRYLFLSASHKEALTTLTYGFAARKSVTVLTGEVGSGKTTLLRTALASASAHMTCVFLSNSALSTAEFTMFLARQFELSDEAGFSKALCYEELGRKLLERHQGGASAALVIDEAHSVSDEVFEDIRHLTNLETETSKLLPVILVGQPELWQRMKSPELRNIRQRVALRCTLRPLDLQESASYIAARIAIAGGRANEVFTRGAVTAIHNASRGLPRAISVLCDNALISGLALDQKPVTAAVVQEICRDFDIPVPSVEERRPATAPVVMPAQHAATTLPHATSAFAPAAGPVPRSERAPADPPLAASAAPSPHAAPAPVATARKPFDSLQGKPFDALEGETIRAEQPEANEAEDADAEGEQEMFKQYKPRKRFFSFGMGGR